MVRIYLMCLTCLRESGHPSPWIGVSPVEDSGIYRATCSKGHDTVTCLQEMRFEILYDIAASAILDGYYREAVSSFAASLERFYEFYIKVHCERRDIDPAEFETTWKLVSNQSERQFGAFVFAYLIDRKISAPTLTNKMVEFRNSVVHKGRIPSRDEAIGFGNDVADVIQRVLSELRKDAQEFISRAVQRHVSQVRQKAAEEQVMFQSTVTMLGLSRAPTEPSPTLESWLAQLAKMRELFARALAEQAASPMPGP